MHTEIPFALLRKTLRGPLLLRDEPGYDAARKVWNTRIDRRPAAIVRPDGTADVLAAVRFANAQGLPVSVRSGGPHVSGMGACDDGLMLDMTRMRSVIVDPEAKTAIVQGGATAADVKESHLFANRVCRPHEVCPFAMKRALGGPCSKERG